MTVRKLRTDQRRREAVPILRQLWTDADPDGVLEWTGSSRYHLFGQEEDGEVVAVAGVLEADFLHHGEGAWLYDLVVDEPRRGEGHGTALLEFVESWAADRGYEFVALASPASKSEVHDFYEDRGYEKWGHVLEREL